MTNKFQIMVDPADYLGKEDFTEYFKKVIEFVKKIEQKLNMEMGMLENKYTEKVNSIKENYGGDMEGMKSECLNYCKEEFKVMYAEHDKIMANVNEKMAQVQNGLDGKDADEEKMTNDVIEKCQEPIIAKVEKDLPKLGIAVRDALELLNGDEKLRVEAIAGLEEYLKNKTGGGKSGGFSLNSLNLHLFDDITPTGIVNGVNTDFILPETPQPLSSLKVYRAGARQRVTEDYTISNKTITFIIPPVVGEIILCDFRA